MQRASTLGDWLALFALTVLWGTTFALNEIALVSFSPSMTVASRLAIASVVIYGYMRSKGVSLPSGIRGWAPLLFLAVFGSFLPFLLVAWAQQYIDSSTAGVLMTMMPLFVLTLAHFFVPGSRLTRHRLAGFVLGFTGVVLVIGPDALAGLNENMAFWGSLAVLGAALSYAINSIFARRLSDTSPLQMSTGMLMLSCLLATPSAVSDPGTMPAPTGSSTLALLVLGLFSTGLATVLYFRVIQGPGPTFLAMVNYLVPAWAVFVGAWFLDETLSWSVFAGLGLILLGIAVSEFAPRMSGRKSLQEH